MTQTEALKLALEALEDRLSLMKWQKARDAVKEALAQPEQEPVAYLCEPDENGLYGLPLTEKTCTKCFPVYRHPQRTWVGLTEEEVGLIADDYSTLQGAIWAIEAKLKELNHG